MTRSSWVFDKEQGKLVPKHEFHAREAEKAGYVVLPDLPDFVSPIDGKRYSGRAGLREHCKIHNVVPNADLQGLPTLTAATNMRHPQDVRASNAERKQQIINLVNKHYR